MARKYLTKAVGLFLFAVNLFLCIQPQSMNCLTSTQMSASHCNIKQNSIHSHIPLPEGFSFSKLNHRGVGKSTIGCNFSKETALNAFSLALYNASNKLRYSNNPRNTKCMHVITGWSYK